MDNSDFVGHLASTAHAFDATAEIAESFIRSYCREMQVVAAKWAGRDNFDEAFSELNTVFRRYWLMDTRFAEYWQPALTPPVEYEIASVATFADMLGNFAVMVKGGRRIQVYLLSVVHDELKIINQLSN